MYLPKPGDYIDIHTHDASPEAGIFKVETLMAHEAKQPSKAEGMTFTAGIHPWHIDETESLRQIGFVKAAASVPDIIAVGEAGFDKLRGPSIEIQRKFFDEQVKIANEFNKPVVIHCVRKWDELFAAYERLKPQTPWLVHGFRGKKELASQLFARGMFISIWFEFALRPESAELLRFLPGEKLFLETDGADVSIQDIFKKVAVDLTISTEELRSSVFDNFFRLFNV